jgi:hypothetical protein
MCKTLKKLLNNLGTESILKNYTAQISFLNNFNWGAYTLNSHMSIRSARGQEIFSPFLDVLCYGVVDLIPQN